MSVIKWTGIILFVFFAGIRAGAQEHLPFTPENTKTGPVLHEKWLAPAVGYLHSANALRLSAVSGNLAWNRAGAYVTFETGLDSNYFTNIYGVTVTVNEYIYVWGGMDLFTKAGLVHSFKGARKEAGIGFTPWKDLVVNTGWSKGMGFSFSLGWKLPVFKGGE